jgi:nucleoside-diphosphate-sugar epimerase
MTPEPVAPLARVLVTGANGFIGQHLQRVLGARGLDWRGAVRSGAAGRDARTCVVGDIGPSTDWTAALDGIDTVVHLAARAHILRETSADPDAEFMRVNAEGTAALVTAAVAAGVRCFIYMSSAGVLGSNSGDAPFTAVSAPRPHNAYARSKLAGELAARSAAGAKLKLVVLRVPLVYGPGVRANFLRLLWWIDREWPLPLGAVHNRRSLLSVWNLCDLLLSVLLNPAARDGTWLASDGEDLSTPELMYRIGAAMGRRVRLMPVPPGLLQLFGRLTGRQALITQLCGSLTLDIALTREQFTWTPPVSVDESLTRTVDWFLAEGRSPRV